MLNAQPIEKLITDSDGSLQVHSIFHTIQGEGPFAGHPAVFVRLAGCNLQCPWCDTDYTSVRTSMTVEEIVRRVRDACKGSRTKLVVITGGEPFRQNLTELLLALGHARFFVQIETNGTLPPPTGINLNVNFVEQYGVYIVCSPKTGKVHPLISTHASCFKYVMAHDAVDPDDGLPITALGHTANPRLYRPTGWLRWLKHRIYLQPMDAKDPVENQRNIDAVVDSCLKHSYILQLQIHKYIGVE